MDTFPERIKAVRGDAGMSQNDFAAAIGVSRSYVARFETGGANMNIPDRIYRLICTEFNVNEEWLRTGHGPRYDQVIIDMIEARSQARGPDRDPTGDLKADALLLAAHAYRQYANIAYACDDIDRFFSLFDIPGFADKIALITSMHFAVVTDPQPQNVRLISMFDTLFDRDFDCKNIVADLKKTGAQKRANFLSTPMAEYLDGLRRAEFWDDDLPNEPSSMPVNGIAAAGTPLFDDTDTDLQVSVPAKYLNMERFYIVQARGDSMTPDIKDGDFVVVQKDTIPEYGGVSCVRICSSGVDEYAIKRFFHDGSTAELRSQNPAHKSLIYPMSEVLSVERVVHIIPRSQTA